MTKTTFQHNIAEHRYEAERDGVVVGIAEYTRAGDAVTFTHTHVDQVYRGRGIAQRLVDYALDDCAATGAHVSATCWYVRDRLAERSTGR